MSVAQRAICGFTVTYLRIYEPGLWERGKAGRRDAGDGVSNYGSV